MEQSSLCVNCLNRYDADAPVVCRICHGDPRVSWSKIRVDLREAAEADVARPRLPAYPGEGMALAISLTMCAAATVALGALSLGLFVLLVILSAVGVLARNLAMRQTAGRAVADQFPKIQRLAELAAWRLGVPLPEVFVEQRREWNAYSAGVLRRGFVVLDSQMLEDLAPEELLFVLGHEIGHIARGHVTLLHLASPFRGRKGGLVWPLNGLFNLWLHRAEYGADRAGLIACGNLQVAMRTLAKLGAGPQASARAMEAEAERGTGVLTILAEYLQTHPFTAKRIAQLRRYDRSREYVRLRAQQGLGDDETRCGVTSF